MPTFQTAVSRALRGRNATLESIVVSDGAMELSYSTPESRRRDATVEQVAAVAATYLFAVRDGVARRKLTAYVHADGSSTPVASFYVEADWARDCLLGDLAPEEYLQRALDAYVSHTRPSTGAGTGSVPGD